MVKNADESLRVIAESDIESPAGGLIEEFCDTFPVDDEAVCVFEKFLSSTNADNRSTALYAIVNYGKRIGYEADAVALHYQTRAGGSPEEYAAVGYLETMGAAGSVTATRLLSWLHQEPYVINLYRGLDQPLDHSNGVPLR